MADTLGLAGHNTYRRYLRHTARKLALPFKALRGRMNYLGIRPVRFTGVFENFDEALKYAKSRAPAGYDNEELADVSFNSMCALALWDYPVLYWLQKIMAEEKSIVDAGGHMGTKYRAFQNYLRLDENIKWTVYDLPSIVRAGKERAARDGLHNLKFCDDISQLDHTEIFLGSGLMQYINEPLSGVLRRMKSLPEHVILNKVAFHDRGHMVTLEKIGHALVPYQMRDERAFCRDIMMLGYQLVDEWHIHPLARTIDTHPELGPSTNKGFYFKRCGPQNA